MYWQINTAWSAWTVCGILEDHAKILQATVLPKTCQDLGWSCQDSASSCQELQSILQDLARSCKIFVRTFQVLPRSLQKLSRILNKIFTRSSTWDTCGQNGGQNGPRDQLPIYGVICLNSVNRLYLIVTCFVVIYYHWSAIVFVVNRPQWGVIIQISCFKLDHAVQAVDSPRPSEPSSNWNVGWLWSHNNMHGVLLFKIILQCALPNSWPTVTWAIRVWRFCTATPSSCQVELTLCDQAASENVEWYTDCSKKASSRMNADLLEALLLASIDALLWWVVSRSVHNLLLWEFFSFCFPIMKRSQTKSKWIRIEIIFTIEYWALFLAGWYIAVRFGRHTVCINDRCIYGAATVHFSCSAWAILQTAQPH